MGNYSSLATEFSIGYLDENEKNIQSTIDCAPIHQYNSVAHGFDSFMTEVPII